MDGEVGGVNHRYSRLKMVAPERLTIPVPVKQGREEMTRVTIHLKPPSNISLTEPSQKAASVGSFVISSAQSWFEAHMRFIVHIGS